jgi:hypothetical protein
MSKPTSFRSIIALWPTQEALALDVGASHDAVRKWAQRGFIPSEWWTSLLGTTRARQAGVNADLLAKLAASREAAA